MNYSLLELEDRIWTVERGTGREEASIGDVMVFTPVYRLERQTVQALMEMEWDGRMDFLFQRDNPHGDPYEDHLHQYQRGREIFLQGNYEAMLVIESDMIPPKDTLKRLARLGCDVAFGVYLFRGGRVVNVLERYYPWPQQARNPGDSLTTRHLMLAAWRAGVIDCSGSGLGCALIRRKVIEAMPFEAAPMRGFFDWHWNEQVYRADYWMRADMRLWCGHVDTNGDELWPALPTMENPGGARVVAR